VLIVSTAFLPLESSKTKTPAGTTTQTRAYRTFYSSNINKPGICGILMLSPFVFVVWALSVMSRGDTKSTTGGDGIFS
jgi:hypothetical protein